MNTFEIGQKVKVSQRYAESEYNTDGSMSAMVGNAGMVTKDYHGPIDLYVSVQLDCNPWVDLFLPEELEAV